LTIAFSQLLCHSRVCLDVLFLIAMGQLQKTNVNARGFMFAGLSSHDLITNVMMHRHGIDAFPSLDHAQTQAESIKHK
jgi:hypothetical protein